MRDLIDLVVEDAGDEVTVSLSGVFGIREFSHLKDKLEAIVNGPGIFFFLDLRRASFLDGSYLMFFLDLLNTLKSRRATLVLIFFDDTNKNYFAPYASIFEIAESRTSFQKNGLMRRLRDVGVHYSKQTGIRITPLVAVVLGILLFGWFLTLLLIVISQNAELSERRERIASLEVEAERSLREIERLETSIGPLRNLGLVGNGEELSAFGSVRDWMLYLDKLDSLRHEK